MNNRPRVWGLVLLVCLCGARALPEPPPRDAEGPAAAWSVILGRPTDGSIALSVLSATPLETRVEYGLRAGAFAATTEVRTASAGVPCEFDLAALMPNAEYRYRLWSRAPGDRDFQPGPEGAFRTRRAAGEPFVFAVQGDSHPEREGKMFDPALYAQTLRNVSRVPPDFYVLMGDDFSIERLIARQALSETSVGQVYARQRSFLGLVGATSPLFLVNGNHEQAALCNLDGTPNSAAALAGRARNRYFPLPAPDAFYSGDADPVANVGLLRDYYAWTWGDALFVVIDPYWHSPVTVDNEAGAEGHGKREPKGSKKRDLWAVTLGDAQYRWLARTLAGSRARWKFVFAHHVLGTGRGGIEQAGLFEWGGKDKRGDDRFKEKRPGWDLPIQPLMAKHGVTIFFQGHDHLFARQELDGVIYQSCPNPADPTYQAFNREAYRSGDLLPNSGHLRITVAPQEVRVDYIRSWLPADETAGHKNGETAFHYTITAKDGAR